MNTFLQVGVKVFLKNKDGKYLFVKRSSIKYPNVNGSWDIVGGRINPGTNLMENLRREVKEETQLEITSVPRLVAAQDIIPSKEKHIVRLSYTAETDGEPILDQEENIEYRWLTIEEISREKDLDKYTKEIIDRGWID